jgi:hypothetical protein
MKSYSSEVAKTRDAGKQEVASKLAASEHVAYILYIIAWGCRGRAMICVGQDDRSDCQVFNVQLVLPLQLRTANKRDHLFTHESRIS